MNQVEYIAILFNDIGIDTVAKRKAWLDLRGYKADIDAMSIYHRSNIIDVLRARKAELKEERNATA